MQLFIRNTSGVSLASRSPAICSNHAGLTCIPDIPRVSATNIGKRTLNKRQRGEKYKYMNESVDKGEDAPSVWTRHHSGLPTTRENKIQDLDRCCIMKEII